MKITINSYSKNNGDITLLTENVNIRKNIFILYKLIDETIKTNYVFLKGYKNKSGIIQYTFEFWGFDTFEEALQAERDLIEMESMKSVPNISDIEEEDFPGDEFDIDVSNLKIVDISGVSTNNEDLYKFFNEFLETLKD